MNGWKQICSGLILLLSACTLTVCAQPAQFVFRITFKDKSGSPPVSAASSFLSQRALDRRTAQGIAIDSNDRPVSPTYISDVLATTGGVYHVSSHWLNTLVILLQDSSKITLLTGKPYISDIKYTGYYQPGLHNKTSSGPSTLDAKGTGSESYYGKAYQQTDLVRGDYLHDRGFKGQGKLIAVIDAGFLAVNTGLGFDSLMKSGRIVDMYDFIHATSNVFTSSFHGTTCLSTMAAYLPGTYVGSAPLAEYALYMTEVEGIDQLAEMDNMVAGMERADSIGADVISSSLGYNDFQAPYYSTLSYADIDGKTTGPARAVNIATQKGMLCVITAGNEGGGSWNYILTPGDADSALTVGSVGNNKLAASNSGFGPNSSGRVKPDVCLQGDKAYIMQSSGEPMTSSGTSYSTPQLAGWAACLWQATSNSTPYKLRSAINASAHRYTTPERQLGYGVPDFGKAFELLGIKNAPPAMNADNWLATYPNPFDKQLTIWLYLTTPEDVSFTLTDVAGKKVYTSTQRGSGGQQLLSLDMPQLPSGTYYLNAVRGDKQTSIKLLKQ